MNADPTRFKRLRVRAGMTLGEVSAALRQAGVRPCSVTTVSCWELGYRSIPFQVRPVLARLLRCRASTLQ
jgi:transcriptional regulator with XRE-family HTH domain